MPFFFLLGSLSADVLLNAQERSIADGGYNRPAPVLSELQHIDDAMIRMLEMISTTLDYVNQVVEGKVEADARVGRHLMDAVAALPKMQRGQFDKVFSSGVQDMLMVIYLANLTRAQLAISEKVNMA